MFARVALAALLAAVVFGATASAGAVETRAAGSARAIGVRVVLPGGGVETAAAVSAPPARSVSSGGYAHPSGAVSTGGATAGARATGGERADAAATATVSGVSLFGGEIAVDAVTVQATARASSRGASGSLGKSALSGVRILGETVAARPNARVPLGDWGYVVLLEQAVVRREKGAFGYRGFVTGLHVHVTAEHGGLPAGTEVMVGYAEAAASAPKRSPAPPPPPPPAAKQPPPPPATSPQPPASPPSASPRATPKPAPPAPRRAAPPAAREAAPPAPRKPAPAPARRRDPVPPPPGARPKPPPSVRTPPRGVKPALTRRGYVFPVYGPASFGDDFAAARADTGWHHGNDVFAPLGAPVLAVADGTLFLVGWNEIGGNRLWLRDERGNEFYYAHLAAYSPLAFDGSRVRAGDVIGFVGDTGDAAGTPPHLHFEIHPRQLLGLGYDGVVNPFSYLSAWRRVVDAPFVLSAAPGDAPPPAVVLLEAEDVSTASGLDAEAVEEVLAMPSLFGEGRSVAAPGPPPPRVLGAPPGFGRAS